MTATSGTDTLFAAEQAIADTVLYEGYVLYPYRASAAKNRVRWQFGVVAPPGYVEATGDETDSQRTEIPAAAGPTATLTVRVRFLQLQARTVEQRSNDEWCRVEQVDVDGRRLISWDEATEQCVDLTDLDLAELVRNGYVNTVAIPGGHDLEAVTDTVRIARTRWPIDVRVRVEVEELGDAAVPELGRQVVKISVQVDNITDFEQARDRALALQRSLLGAHTLMSLQGGAFLSVTDPPEWAKDVAAGCDNFKTWPVLTTAGGPASVVLSSPIILPDFPAIAPESGGDFFDGTEIDEMLTLRVMTLTPDEKVEARATDERARKVLDRVDHLPPDMLAKLHGAVRQFGAPRPVEAVDPFRTDAPYWAPEAEVAPEIATALVGGIHVGRGDRVRLQPGPRGDSMDLFLRGRTATVVAVHTSVDDDIFVAVLLDDDPAAELHHAAGRYLFYRPHELEFVEPAADSAPPAPPVTPVMPVMPVMESDR